MSTAILLIVTLASATARTEAQDASASQTRALELAKRLGSTKSSSFAAALPDDPSRFVAALHIPGVQMLLITGTYTAPALLRELILKGDYQRVYLDMNSSSNLEGRFFVEDLGADGLRPDRERNEAFDITWRDGTVRTLYNGDWRAQKLSEDEYRARFAKDAAEYARLLEVLLTAHRAQSPPP